MDPTDDRERRYLLVCPHCREYVMYPTRFMDKPAFVCAGPRYRTPNMTEQFKVCGKITTAEEAADYIGLEVVSADR